MLDNDTRPERRTALIAKELGQGQLQEKKYTFFWSGRADERREAGVAFAIHNQIAKKLPSLPTGTSERIISLRVPVVNQRFLCVICVYAPTMLYSNEDKEAFYQSLGEVVDKVPKEDKLLILGDLNARVGNDYTAYEGVIGKFGKGKKNSNGELLLNFCTQHELSITNTFFFQPEKNYFTWKHPRSRHSHLLDYVVTRKTSMSEVLSTKAIRGAECSTDHYMVRSQLRLKLVLPRHKKPANAPSKKLNVSKLRNIEQQDRLASSITAALDANVVDSDDVEELWKRLKQTAYNTAEEVLGHLRRKSPDWFQDNEKAIQCLLVEKQRAYNKYLQESTASTEAAFKSVKSKVQREIRAMKDKSWSKEAEELQEMADKNDSHGLFCGLKAIYGPRSNSIAPVRNADGSLLFTNMDDIKARWKEHFCNLLNQQGIADPQACNMIQPRETREELSTPITDLELEKALKTTRCGKAPGQDGIPADLWKNGGQSLKRELLRLYNVCWTKACIPQDFKDVVIVTMYKKKGLRSECGNHRGISLLSIAGKILAKIILNRIKIIAEKLLPESQCGFRPGRSTTDMIFTLRQLQEKAIEQQQALYVVFVDFAKAFDTVDRDTLWKVLELYGCPGKIVKIIKYFHEGMSGKVSIGGDVSDTFKINHRRCGGLMVSVLDSGSSCPGSGPGRGDCVVFLGKTLYSHGASLHPGV